MTTYYTVYKITNLINKKIYIGVHKTMNQNDNYFGSGIYIKKAIKLYGKENFQKEILASFDTPKEAYEYEKSIVTSEFIKRSDTYNLTIGGILSIDWDSDRILEWKVRISGENHPMFGKHHSEETKKEISKKCRLYKHSAERRQKISDSNKGRASYWKGKIQSEESNSKRSESHKNLSKIECPHCKKLIDPGNAKKWHFDKCKFKLS